VKQHGSFYLQSKIYRAHELLMEFQAEKHQQDKTAKPKNENSDNKDSQ